VITELGETFTYTEMKRGPDNDVGDDDIAGALKRSKLEVSRCPFERSDSTCTCVSEDSDSDTGKCALPGLVTDSTRVLERGVADPGPLTSLCRHLISCPSCLASLRSDSDTSTMLSKFGASPDLISMFESRGFYSYITLLRQATWDAKAVLWGVWLQVMVSGCMAVYYLDGGRLDLGEMACKKWNRHTTPDLSGEIQKHVNRFSCSEGLKALPFSALTMPIPVKTARDGMSRHNFEPKEIEVDKNLGTSDIAFDDDFWKQFPNLVIAGGWALHKLCPQVPHSCSDIDFFLYGTYDDDEALITVDRLASWLHTRTKTLLDTDCDACCHISVSPSAATIHVNITMMGPRFRYLPRGQYDYEIKVQVMYNRLFVSPEQAALVSAVVLGARRMITTALKQLDTHAHELNKVVSGYGMPMREILSLEGVEKEAMDRFLRSIEMTWSEEPVGDRPVPAHVVNAMRCHQHTRKSMPLVIRDGSFYSC